MTSQKLWKNKSNIQGTAAFYYMESSKRNKKNTNGGSRAAATSKMERFVIIVNGNHGEFDGYAYEKVK